MGRVALGVALVGAMACSGYRSASAPTSVGVSVDPPATMSLTGHAIPVTRELILFLQPAGRTVSTVYLSSATVFSKSTLVDVDAIAAANLSGFQVQATVTGTVVIEIDLRALTILAASMTPAQPFRSVSPTRMFLHWYHNLPLLVASGRSNYLITEWSIFDTTGDVRSLAEWLASPEGFDVCVSGDGIAIDQQMMLMRTVRVLKEPVANCGT